MNMPSVVRFLELDPQGNQQEVGRLSWDGSRLHASPDGPLMRNVLAEPIAAPAEGGPKRLTAQDGEAFLNGLQFQYRSAYLMATAPEESGAASPEPPPQTSV